MFFTTAGSGYSLKYVGLTLAHQPFGQTISGSFAVSTGVPYKLVFEQSVGNSFGGQPFSSNPIVGVADRGGNVISSVNEGFITATLTTNPTQGLLRPSESLAVPVINGFGNFSGLYINEAAEGYQITFNTTIQVLCSYILFSSLHNILAGNLQRH